MKIKKGRPLPPALSENIIIFSENQDSGGFPSRKSTRSSRFQFLTLLLISFFLSLGTFVNAQSTYIYQSVPTHQLLADLDFEMGNVKAEQGMLGYELNFWAVPFFTGNRRSPIMTVQGLIDINFGFSTTDNSIGYGIKIGSNEAYGTLKTQSNQLWCNINLRVMYDSFVLLNAWQGNNWYELNPTLKALLMTPDSSTWKNNSTMKIRKTMTDIGSFVGDFRVLKIIQTDSWGQFLRHYEVPFNARWTNTLNYIFIREGTFVQQPSNDPSYNVASYSLKKMDVLRCNQSMAMQADGTCSMNCLTNKCLFCQSIDKQYLNQCRFCDGVSSSCQAISKCPTDYYLEYGICYKCPIGCSSCQRADLCTSCDQGLVLNEVKQVITFTNALNMQEEKEITLSGTCDCPIGQFGTNFVDLDQVQCAKCDDTCYTCIDLNVKCTACAAPLFWIDIDGGMCVGNCPELIPNYFGDMTDRRCKPCAGNCKKCTSLTGCTECDNYNATVPVTQQKKDADGLGLVDENAQPIMETINTYVPKKLLNAEGTCMQACPTNSIDNSTTYFLCHMCPAECLTCDGISSNCTTCSGSLGYYLYQYPNVALAKVEGRCLAQCPDGFYPDGDKCSPCDSSCTVCEEINKCYNCTMDVANNLLYHFVNFQCKIICGERFYPDHSDPSFYFCRSCPSNCLECDSARRCTSCVNNYYLTSLNGYQLCVRAKDCAPGSFPDDTGVCLNCIVNCKSCGGLTGCNECFDGYFLNNNACINRCPTAKFAMPSGKCENCISHCDECKDSLTCKTCTTNYVLLEDKKSCVAGTTCPDGYYLGQQNNCTLCKPECDKCTSLAVCTACILGHTLNGANCEKNCGNGIRQDKEDCDDGNDSNGDGCKIDCTVEDLFICEQGIMTALATSAPDTCRCDPQLSIAEWTDYWGTIRVVFDSQIYYNSTTNAKSDIPLTFCQQILTVSTIARLGTNYGCYLWIGTQSELIIDVGKDAIIGNKNENYETSIELIEGAILVMGCSLTGIPVSYKIKNLPLDNPQVLFTSTYGSNTIPLCNSAVTLNLATSKGFTKRNVDVVWTLISLTPQDDTLKEALQQALDDTFRGYSFYTISEPFVEQLQGKTITIQSRVTNFLGRDSRNQTSLVFTKKKQVEIIDLPDTITFQTSIENQLYPRFRLAYCNSDITANLEQDYRNIKYRCEMYDVALTSKRWPLINCTIPAYNMTLVTQYIVEVIADFEGDATMTNIKKVVVQPSSPPVQVALIQGCNRVFSPNNSFSLSAIINTNLNTTTFVWQCTDKATGSVCFSTTYQYITLGNSAKITVSKDIFFYGMQYEFKVTAFDASSATNSSITCLMYSSGPKDRILDVQIEGEATQTGFIDFTRKQTAFKTFITNMEVVTKANLIYKWQISDSSGKVMKSNEVSIYQNSIGVSTDLLNRNSLYSVTVKVNDGVSWGNATQILRTKPDLSNEFNVEPSDLDPKALTTKFSLSIYSQRTFDTLDQYVFGYVNPTDGTTKIPMTQKTYKKFVQFILPEPISGSTITCYAEVIQPNRVSMTFFKTVTVGLPDMTVQIFNEDVASMVMDDLVESMQLKHKLVSMRSKLTVSQRSAAIRKILEGLQKETTPLSDYYIQSSVASLLEYISLEVESLLSDAQIVTVSAAIFQQITIGENKDLASGKSLQYGRSVTSSLFNFANNLFSKDFTSLIGGQVQLQMKVMFMQGLKNVLKGSLSNFILGDAGGFAYQGQNIYAKAVKFDTLENTFKINATLPKSISGKFVQSFVNITLPGSTSLSNPCRGMAACQVSIIILDTPITRFISNSKDSSLKSMLVDMSISETEVASPNPYILIKDIAVKNLADPILMTIPLNSELNTTNPNNTLGCGYIDEVDQIFKQTGIVADKITNSLVTCQASHLTSIAVEEFSEEKKGLSQAEKESQTAASANEEENTAVLIINMWNSWAIYAEFALVPVMLLGLLYTRKKDAKDELNLEKIKKAQKRIYVNLYLDPIQEIRRQAEIEKPKLRLNNQDDYFEVDQTAKPMDAVAPVDDLFGPTPVINPIPIEANLNDDGQSQRSRRTVKKKIKKKKKKVEIDPAEQDLFFEGGGNNTDEYPENTRTHFEGGDEDDFFAIADAEESQRTAGKKKKKKKKGLGYGFTQVEREDMSALPALPPLVGPGAGRRAKNVVEEINLDDDQKSLKSKKSSRSKSRSKTMGKSKSKERQSLDLTNNANAQPNSSNYGGFNFKPEDDAQSSRSKGSKRSTKSKKKKKRGRSKTSVQNNDEEEEAKPEKPDYQASEISPKKTKKKKNLRSKKTKIHDDDADIIAALNTEGLEQRVDTQSKGFETLMNEELEKTKNEIGKKKKRVAANKKKTEEKKKKEFFEKEAATCIQFCIWNCKENHRFRTLFRYYNQYLSRSSRWILMVMSWMMFIMINGYMVEGDKIIAGKSVKTEQFACGTVAAFIARIWIVFVTGLLMHSKREKVYQEIMEAAYAKRTVCLNTLRYYFGLIMVMVTIIVCFSNVFAFSKYFTPSLVSAWMWCSIFSILSDLVIVDGAFIALTTLLTMTVGAAPDACGRFRNTILKCVPQAIRDAAE